MKKQEIYYFTGTGNSLTIAKILHSLMPGSHLLPIASLSKEEPIRTDADMVGIVFPVYYSDLPNVIQRFAKQLEPRTDAYVFAICTYGGAAGNSLKHLQQILQPKGGLSAGFGVHMPQNAFYKFWENKQRIYDKSAKRIQVIHKKIASQKKGMYYSNVILQKLITPFNGWIRKMTIRFFEEITQTPYDSQHTMEELIPISDTSFRSTDNCTSCGICEQICPVGNIQLKDGRPNWLHHCENCLACYHYCPQQAIKTGITKKDYHYQHPEIQPTEIMKQKKRNQ
jgi:ferredoxin